MDFHLICANLLTLNFSASLSYGLLLSTRALALHIVQMAANVPRSSADNELFGLPGRTNACVPLLNGKYNKICHVTVVQCMDLNN